MSSVASRRLPTADNAGSGRPLLRWLTTRRAALGWVLLGTLLQLVREPGVPTWRAVFGEDGGIFLTEALASPGWGSLMAPYQGYVQLAPRLLAEGIAMLPLHAAALGLALGAALSVSLLSLFIYWSSGTLLYSRWARLAVAVAPVLLPAGAEINASITNLHWYLDYACFWALAAAPKRWRMVSAAALVAALAVLSDPLAGLFLPLAAWRGWQALALTATRPGRVGRRPGPLRQAELVVPAAFAVAGVVQLALGAAQQRPDRFLPSSWSDLPAIFGLRVAGSFLLGDRYLPRLYADLGLPFAVLCLAVVAVALAVAVRPRSSRPLVLLAASYSVLWLVVPLMLRGTETFLDRAQPGLPGSRYMLIPILLLTVCGVAWLDALPARTTSARAAATVAFAVVAGLSWSIPSQRSEGPEWMKTLVDAQGRCEQAAGTPIEVGRSAQAPWGLPARTGQVLVPVAPAGPQPAWSVLVDCRSLGVGAGPDPPGPPRPSRLGSPLDW